MTTILHPTILDENQKQAVQYWANQNYQSLNEELWLCGQQQIRNASIAQTNVVCTKRKVNSIAFKLLTCFEPLKPAQ